MLQKISIGLYVRLWYNCVNEFIFFESFTGADGCCILEKNKNVYETILVNILDFPNTAYEYV